MAARARLKIDRWILHGGLPLYLWAKSPYPGGRPFVMKVCFPAQSIAHMHKLMEVVGCVGRALAGLADWSFGGCSC
jgi:hypothetical protein